MHVTIRQLQIFEALARRLSFTAAARELHLTQPGVSSQVRQLESAVGMPLVEQVGRRVSLTDAGRVLERLSLAVAAELREAEQALDELKGIRAGRLRVCVVSTVNYFATRLLSQYCAAYPGVQVSLEVTNRQRALAVLAENSADIVLMGQPPAGLDVEARAFKENPLVVIAATGHPLVGRRRVSLAALARETFLVREPGSGTRMAMERLFQARDFQPRTTIEMTSNEAIKQAVEAGLGLGVVSLHTIGLELDAGRLAVLEVRHFPIRRRWHVVHRRGKRLSGAAQAFRRFVLEHA